jgi:septum formation protein
MVASLGIPFQVRAPHVDETPVEGEPADRYLERVVDSKLAAVRVGDGLSLRDTDGILVADTVVVAPGGAILGKPRDDADARAMLATLSGQTHTVSTRFALAPTKGRAAPWHAETVTTRVVFRALDGAEIDAYVATGEGKDKAGAYAVQGLAGAFVSRIEGSYTAVVGLPLSELVVALRKLGWLGPTA